VETVQLHEALEFTKRQVTGPVRSASQSVQPVEELHVVALESPEPPIRTRARRTKTRDTNILPIAALLERVAPENAPRQPERFPGPEYRRLY